MGKDNSDQISFDGPEEIIISPDLKSVFIFLIQIDQEVKSLLSCATNPPIIRCQMICLFAFMETIFCLITVYEYELKDKKEIINNTNNNIRKLILEFILSEKNEFYTKNKEKLVGITANMLKDLRNMLTHFYSVNHISVIEDDALNKAYEITEEVNKKKNIKLNFITPNILYNLLKGANKLLLDKWSREASLEPDIFKRKMEYVQSIVNGEGAQIVKFK